MTFVACFSTETFKSYEEKNLKLIMQMILVKGWEKDQPWD